MALVIKIRIKDCSNPTLWYKKQLDKYYQIVDDFDPEKVWLRSDYMREKEMDERNKRSYDDDRVGYQTSSMKRFILREDLHPTVEYLADDAEYVDYHPYVAHKDQSHSTKKAKRRRKMKNKFKNK